MADQWLAQDLGKAIIGREFPTITLWNRLEGRPRVDRFDRALRAEVRDALWLLTRQWQLGEFRGDDAGSPILVKAAVSASPLTRFQPDGHDSEPFDDTMPLEARVEARPLALTLAGREVGLDLRLLMGRQWLKMLAPVGDFAAEFAASYPIHTPDPTVSEDAVYTAHPEVWASYAAVAGRRMDGAKLYSHLAGPGNHAWDGIAALDALRDEVDAIAERFVRWFDRLVYQPPAADAWIPERLEYQFACAAPSDGGQKVLVAEEYFHGHLDWHNVDVDPDAESLGGGGEEGAGAGPPDVRELLPTPVTFEGMPHTRWWGFEDGRTNFGDTNPDTTDLGKLMLMEFALIYANDWFLIPYTAPVGSVVRVEGLAVTNVFGERTFIEAAGSGDDADWQRWAMFNSSVVGDAHQPADTALVLLPTVVTVQDSRPHEEVLLVRDEVANMVWGVERVVPLASGETKPGAEAARETRAFFEQDLERRLGAPPVPPAVAEGARVRYEAMRGVPEHWTPFIPVHVDGDNREIQLQRAAMPRLLEGDPDPPRKVRPRTALLRQGLDEAPPTPYFMHEGEVLRAGVRLTQAFERTRWRDGRVWVWRGVRKQTGRGEASSGLAFDRLVDAPPTD
ncbi:MAG TPA: hypothetical protein VML96_13695 [Egibacteraceae bacterium]|nr:hypothetical protein [Egibacteraceae bacterium]